MKFNIKQQPLLTINKAQKVTTDIVFNFIASAVPLFVLQFLIQPYVARILGAERYGAMLTIIGLVNIGIGMFGNPLNNARLIDNKYYIKQKGDYNIFLSLLCLLNTVFIFVSVHSYDLNIDGVSYLLLLSISIFSVVISYLEADYRIHLNYKRIMFSKIIQTSGYGLGCFLFAKTRRWEWIFFIGYGLNLIFVFATTSLWKEPFRITNNIKETTKRIIFLVLSSAIGSILTYVDRLIIFPIFGGAELSIYYAASVVGKTVLMVTSPLTSVLLSYSVRLKSISRKQFFTYILILLAVAGAGYVVCFSISDPLISLLYPDCLAGSRQYIPWTVAASMLGVVYSFVWPLVLRFGKNSYPSLITIFKAAVYVLVALLTVRKFGIMGICYANLLSTGAQVLVVIILGFKVCDRKDN